VSRRLLLFRHGLLSPLDLCAASFSDVLDADADEQVSVVGVRHRLNYDLSVWFSCSSAFFPVFRRKSGRKRMRKTAKKLWNRTKQTSRNPARQRRHPVACRRLGRVGFGVVRANQCGRGRPLLKQLILARVSRVSLTICSRNLQLPLGSGLRACRRGLCVPN